MLFQFLRGVITLTIISALGGGVSFSLNFGFLSGFILTIVLQIILFNTVKYFRDGHVSMRIREIELEEIKSFEKQGMELDCAHCREPVFVPIRFDEQNGFDCPKCEKTNAIYVNVTVARETTPLNIDAITTKLIVDEEEKIKDEMLITGNLNE